MNEYINISKASSSSLVEKAGASTAFNSFIPIKEIAQAKGLKSTRSIRMEINKPESKYISREVKVNGGMSYEILFSSLEPELQQKLRECETKSTAIVPLNYKPPVITDKARQTANHRMNIVKAALEHRNKYPTIKQADAEFLDLYNSGLYLPKAYEFLGSISIGTLRRYIQAYKKTGNAESLIPQYKITKQGEYNSILDDNMKKVLLALLLHQNKFGYNTAIRLAKQVLIKKGYDEDALPSNITFKRFAEHFRKNNYAEWVLRREGMKAYHDKVEPYIERDISKIEVGDVLIADGHVLNFQVINPFTGKPTRATLVGFLDWKSTALVGYEIMMTENTQCIASALRNAIINLGIIPKVVYQDNGKAFKSKFFQNADFDEGIQKVHPMANILGTVKDMEEYKQQYQKQQKIKSRLIKQIKKTFTKDELQVLEIEPEPVLEIEEQPKPKREHKQTPREQQMNVPMFNSNYEKYEWLMTNGTTNPQDRKWLADYIKSDEYYNLYGD